MIQQIPHRADIPSHCPLSLISYKLFSISILSDGYGKKETHNPLVTTSFSLLKLIKVAFFEGSPVFLWYSPIFRHIAHLMVGLASSLETHHFLRKLTIISVKKVDIFSDDPVLWTIWTGPPISLLPIEVVDDYGSSYLWNCQKSLGITIKYSLNTIHLLFYAGFTI